eukprot:207252_1
MSKSSLKEKISIKIAFIIILMYIPFTKSHVNGTFGRDIVILETLASQQIETLGLSMYFWCASHHFYDIIKRTHFYIQNQCVYEYVYRITFALPNTDWINSTQMCLLMNNDISTCFVAQKKRNEIDIYTHLLWVINSKISIINNDNNYSTMLGKSIRSIKMELHHFYEMKSVDICDPCTAESWRMMDIFSINIPIKTYMDSALTTFDVRKGINH